MALRTRDRWPQVGAAAALPVTLAARRNPRLRPLAALMWHQTEEWVWPGGFIVWINREVIGSNEDEFPLDRDVGFWVNVGFGWSAALADLAGARGAVPVAMLYASNLANTGLHLGWAARNRRYDPGAITSAVTLVPAAVDGFRRLRADPNVSDRAIATGVALGLVFGAAFAPVMKLRARR